MGRKKIDIKSITKKSSRLMTFSKRRLGLFKKANELATLCDAQVATVMFSPGGKPFSFGQPNVKTVMGCILNLNEEPTDGMDISNEGRINLLNQQLDDLNNQLRAEKKRGKVLAEKSQKSIKDMVSFENLGIDELKTMKESLKELKKTIIKQINELEACDSLLLLSDSIKSDD